MQAERFTKEDQQRVILNDLDFQRLVRGGVVRTVIDTHGVFGVTRRRVSIALSDIGFDQMHMLIEEAEGLR